MLEEALYLRWRSTPLVGNSFEQKLQQAAGGRQAVGKFVLGEDAD
jgi:hypothetical protein